MGAASAASFDARHRHRCAGANGGIRGGGIRGGGIPDGGIPGGGIRGGTLRGGAIPGMEARAEEVAAEAAADPETDADPEAAPGARCDRSASNPFVLSKSAHGAQMCCPSSSSKRPARPAVQKLQHRADRSTDAATASAPEAAAAPEPGTTHGGRAPHGAGPECFATTRNVLVVSTKVCAAAGGTDPAPAPASAPDATFVAIVHRGIGAMDGRERRSSP